MTQLYTVKATNTDNTTTDGITKVGNVNDTTNAKTTTADNTTIVKGTTTDDSRAQTNPMERQMVSEKSAEYCGKKFNIWDTPSNQMG